MATLHNIYYPPGFIPGKEGGVRPQTRPIFPKIPFPPVPVQFFEIWSDGLIFLDIFGEMESMVDWTH
jgi:hypothetical protein